MSKVVNRVLTEQLGGRHSEEFIGRPGDLFYDAQSGQLRIGDGETIGGHSITESSALESIFIGPWVHFVRPEEQPEVMDHIDENLILARSDGGLLYNAYDQENGYELSNPSGTEWNTDGWQDLTNVKTRYYQNLSSSLSGGGWATVKHEWIMHDTNNNKYYAIRFLTWDSGNNYATGAFSYIRREINANVFFSRDDTEDEETALTGGDEIDTGLTITRGSGQAIFNYGLGPVTNQVHFDPVTNNCDSCTFNTDTAVVSFVNPTGDLLTSLQQMKAGDPVYIDFTGSGNGTSQNIVDFNLATFSFTIDWAPGNGVVNPTFVYLNVTTTAPQETNYDEDQSPKGTLWNQEGIDDLSNLKSRQFVLFDDLFAGQNLGKRILGRDYVMWDTVNDKYYAITFTRWQQGNNSSYPGFSYIRRQIDVNKLTSGLKFPDGTVQTTAYSDKISGVLKQSPRLASQVGTRYITPQDIGRTIYLYAGTNTTNLQISDGGAADFPIGSTITIINRTGNTVYLYKDNDDENGTIYGAGTSWSGTGWQIPDNGGGNICTLMKIETGMDNFFNDWMLSGANISLD